MNIKMVFEIGISAPKRIIRLSRNVSRATTQQGNNQDNYKNKKNLTLPSVNVFFGNCGCGICGPGFKHGYIGGTNIGFALLLMKS
jgi:hypothetical protein